MRIREVIKNGTGFIIGDGDLEKIYAQAVQDARTLEKGGVDAIIVENMGDGPFGVTLDLVQRTTLTAAVLKVCNAVHIPVGVDAAFCDWEVALSVAYSTGCDFVRIPVFVDTVEFYGGIITPCAKDCMHFRHALGADDIMILADIQVKHTNMLLPHVDIEKSAKTAAECGADAIIVTGSAIGTEAPIEMIERVKRVTALPVIAGSGINAKNIDRQLHIADGAIIGSSFKEGGVLSNPISFELLSEVLERRGKR